MTNISKTKKRLSLGHFIALLLCLHTGMRIDDALVLHLDQRHDGGMHPIKPSHMGPPQYKAVAAAFPEVNLEEPTEPTGAKADPQPIKPKLTFMKAS